MKKITAYFLLISLLISCKTQQQNSSKNTKNFKVIGYYAAWACQPEDLDIDGLTHINFSFGIPEKEENALEAIKNEDKLLKITQLAHQKNKKVFLAVGGWSVGDGGGNDQRFHRVASTAANRTAFVKSMLEAVQKYNLDGIDMDWEYPDENHVSADDFVLLMRELYDALHQNKKELSAAVVSKGKKGFGIKKEAFEFVDWINLMAYDNDHGKPAENPHSTIALAEESLNYWIVERGLPASKAVLGLPFYGKPGYEKVGGSYKNLIAAGANPTADDIGNTHYNGTKTIQAKTLLAKQRGCAGVMIWEICHDTKDETSLIKAINSVNEKKQ